MHHNFKLFKINVWKEWIRIQSTKKCIRKICHSSTLPVFYGHQSVANILNGLVIANVHFSYGHFSSGPVRPDCMFGIFGINQIHFRVNGEENLFLITFLYEYWVQSRDTCQ